MDPQYVAVFNLILALVLSLSCHEWAHAWVAKLQGDCTAESEGRLTLNPISHIDIIGTLILPIIMALTSSGILGWAKPVPVNISQLRSQRWGPMLVAVAGPMANLVLCFGFCIVFALYRHYQTDPNHNDLVLALVLPMIQVNAILAVFNLIPLAPLDGGTVFSAFLPSKLREIYDLYVAPYGMFILLAMMISGSLSWVWALAQGYIGAVILLLETFINF